MQNAGLLGGRDPENSVEGFDPTSGGLLDGLQHSDVGSGLSLILEPKDIATIPGLPQHVYDDAARQERRGPVGATGQPGGYVSSLDQVSLASQDLNPSRLDLSAPATQVTDKHSMTGEKYEQGATAAKYFGNAIDWWNGQNKILGLHFGEEGPKVLEKYTGPIGKGLVAMENGLKAGGEMANGAPVIPTVTGAAIKTGSTLGAVALGGQGGAAAGTAVFGAPVGTTIGGVAGGILGGFAPDWVYQNMSNQQIGEAAGHIVDDAGDAYRRYVIDNPYYDPRLVTP